MKANKPDTNMYAVKSIKVSISISPSTYIAYVSELLWVLLAFLFLSLQRCGWVDHLLSIIITSLMQMFSPKMKVMSSNLLCTSLFTKKKKKKKKKK